MLILKFLLLLIILYLFYAIIPSAYFKIKYILKRKKVGNTLYLTFDDGPDPKYTNKLLDILKKYNIKASFFCVASFAQHNPDIIERLKKERHLIGLHSLKHTNACLMGVFKTNKDFKTSVDIMQDRSCNIKYFRPPWGDINLSSLYNFKKYNLKLILWHVMTEDWEKNVTPLDIEVKLLQRIKGGDIICLHDGRGSNEAPKKMLEALDNVIPILKNKGYKFETVDKYEN